MSYYASADERGRFIAGLRELAAFLESRPDVPISPNTAVHVFPPTDTDRERRAEIDAIASRICAQAREMVSGHYVASRFFGPIEYRAVAIDHETERD
jgi:hypothetical protein